MQNPNAPLRPLADLFVLPEVALIANCTQYFDECGITFDAYSLYADVGVGLES